ncbi:MAG: iron complex outermembrane receptor protein [Flavobacteriales bacterium]|jgi:iron complex outermembrane receptor protein
MSTKLREAIKAVNKSRSAALVTSIGTLALMGISATAGAQEDAAITEEMLITGIRGSVMQAIDIKRNSTGTVDAISAEDIGKFPDKNVADSLARIPGVTINRDFGEGQGVTIRGFSPDQNKTMLNGQAVGTAQWFVLRNTGRNFNFEMLASEIVGEVQVYKSSQADLEEGGLGGTVNVLTRKPLDMDANTFAANVEGQYSANPDVWDPAASGMYSWKNDTETFGINVALTHSQRTVERLSQESDFGWFGPNIARIEGGLAAPDGETEKGSIAWGVGSAIFNQDRERNGLDTTVQYRPNDDMEFSVHYMDVEMKASNTNSNLLGIPFRGLFNGDARDGVGSTENGFVTSLEFAGDAAQPGWANYLAYDNIYRDGSKMSTSVFDINFDYQIGDAHIHAVAGTTKGKGDIFDFFTEFWGDGTDPRVAIIYENADLATGPNVEFEQANPWLANPTDQMYLGGIFNQQNFTEDQENYLGADLTLDVELGAINELKFGAKIRDRSFTQSRFSDNLSNLSATGDGSLGPASDFWTGALHTPDHANNSLSSQTYFAPDRGLMWDAFWDQPSCSTALLDAGTTCLNENTANNLSTFQIDETINSLYAMASFEVEAISGNFGVRYTDTSTDAFGGDDPVPTVSSYSDILPSFQVKYDVSADVVLRTSAARVMVRPSPFDQAPAFNLTPETSRGQAGNPALQPTYANQYDIGAEWYYAEGAMLAATWFRKDINNFTFLNTGQGNVDGVLINQLTRPENGGKADYEGVELSITHAFENGFGGFANYTLVDASTATFPSAVLIDDGVNDPSAALVQNEIEFPDVSDNSYNIGGFYEQDAFSARLSYNYRSDYFQAQTEWGAQFRDEYGQWDAQFSYNITDNISVKAEAINLTDESFNNYMIQSSDVDGGHSADGTKVVTTESSNGSRFIIGLAVKF